MGNVNAMYEVGWRCEYYGETDDAVKWYQAAAGNGHVEAMLRLGHIYMNGFSIPEQAFAMFSMALENDNDNIEAKFEVACCKLFGIGTSKDAGMAFNLFKNIDESGEYNIFRNQAQIYLAHCYLNGDGVAKDVSKAIGYIRQGLDKNIPLASFLMAECLFYGKGVGQNYGEAAKFAKNAAVNGMVKAQRLLNECFKRGNLSWNSTRELQDYAAQLKMTVDDKRVLVKNDGDAPLAVVPYGVVAIDESAFAYSRMRNVEISDTVEYIAKYAFSDCNELKEVIIPASVKKIGNAIFKSCRNLEKVVVLSEQIDFEVTSILYTSYSGELKVNNLKEILISPRAGFDGEHQNLVKLLPLTERQTQGYDLCRVNSAGELQPLNILVKKVIVPDDVKSLGCGFAHNKVCVYCGKGTCLSSCVGRNYNPRRLKCKHDTGLVDLQKDVETIVLPDSVVDLGAGFRDCPNLKNINIPNSVQVIPERAFAGCRITYIVLPASVKKIEEGAFENCENLTEIVVPDGVTHIRKKTFKGCRKLSKVIIPDSVTVIEQEAFRGCPLKELHVAANTKVDTSGHESGIEFDSAGRWRNAVKETYFPKDCKIIRRTSTKQSQGHNLCSLSEDGKTLIAVPDKSITKCVIPPGVRYIGKGAFQGCQNLREVIFPKGVSQIEENAFNGCIRLTSVVLPEGLFVIKAYAFSECTNLRSVTIPDSIKKIEENAFYNCQRLASIEIPWGTEVGDQRRNTSNWDSIKITGRLSVYQKDGINVCRISEDVVSTSPNGGYRKQYSVYGVCSYDITRCVIPKNVELISPEAFAGCTKLESIRFTDNITQIGKRAFKNCYSLKKVVLPKEIINIEQGTFSGCIALEEVIIPEGIMSIESKAFEHCDKLKKVKVPSAATIANDAFPAGCKIIRY